MKLFLVISLLVSYTALSQSRSLSNSVNPLAEFDREEVLSPEFQVGWHVNTDTKMITFEVVAKTTGWVGFGISKNASMTGADIVFGGVNAGTNYFEDRFGIAGHSEPVLDAQTNWKLNSATEDAVAGTTSLKFERLFDTGDVDQDVAITEDEVSFIWAIGNTDTIGYHAKRGFFAVNILKPDETVTATDPSTDPATDPASTTTTTTTTTAAYGPDFVRTQELSVNCTVTWQVYLSRQRVIFEVEAATTGYVSFGISQSGTMTNADVIMGGINDDKTAYFSDRFSPGHGEPTVDPEQNWEFLEGREVANRTYLRFVRSFVSTDTMNDFAITDKRTYFIWAIGSTDDTSKRHTSRGAFRVNILKAKEVNFARTEHLNENITATWHVDFDNENVVFEVEAKTKGYVGFGFGDFGNMTNADLIIGGVNDDLSPYFDDRFSTRHGQPVIDAQQDWKLLAASEDYNTTYLRFVRSFDTGDSAEDYPILDGETNFIWALGSDDNTTKRHASRGSYQVNIMQPSVNPVDPTTSPAPLPNNFVRQERINENLTVQWEVDFVNELITFETKALTSGYIGFGIGDAGTMYNADLIIGGVDEKGVTYFNDRFSTRHGEPVIDTYQNWFLISATEKSNITTLRFIRGFDTGDKEGDFAIEDRETNFIWALGSTDDLKRHATRGAYAVNLLEPPVGGPSTDPTTPGNGACESVYTRTAQLAADYGVTWEVDVIQQTVNFQVVVKTVGFVGFGFSESSSMKNADLIYGGVKEGKSYFEDMFATDNTRPTKDKEQNWILTEATEVSGTTTLKFGRKIVTTDATTEDLPIEDKSVYFIWAIGATDDLDYHDTNRGSFAVNILECSNTGTGSPTPDPEESTQSSGDRSAISSTLITLMIFLASRLF